MTRSLRVITPDVVPLEAEYLRKARAQDRVFSLALPAPLINGPNASIGPIEAKLNTMYALMGVGPREAAARIKKQLIDTIDTIAARGHAQLLLARLSLPSRDTADDAPVTATVDRELRVPAILPSWVLLSPRVPRVRERSLTLRRAAGPWRMRAYSASGGVGHVVLILLLARAGERLGAAIKDGAKIEPCPLSLWSMRSCSVPAIEAIFSSQYESELETATSQGVAVPGSAQERAPR
ncbi:hypothetical protein T492DRAFT_855041 [Pavlovales sp. CCMP2436]|nr:hypothetical protein T492DRAFT_855041 [Pavlovales sp. CCMP2436]